MSNLSSAYTASKEERWQFEQYGDRVVAVHANAAPQSFILGSSTAFEDLAGSPPRARHVAVWGDFLVLGGLTDFPSRVQWSGLDDPEFWTLGSNNSDFQEFPDGGPVQGMTSANNPLILQESSIRRAVFVPGSDVVFTFDKLHDKRGTKAKYSLGSRGEFTFFLAEDGFYQIDNQGGIASIGFEKVNRYFFDQASPGSIEDTIAAVDPINSRVYWAFNANRQDVFDAMLIYDWVLQKWSRATASIYGMLPVATPGYTLEQLDTISTSIEDLPFSLDSRVYAAGAPALAAFDSRNRLSFYSGSNAQATITTQEFGDAAGGVARLSELLPAIDTNDVFVDIAARMRRGDAFTWLGEGRPSTNTGIIRKRSRARYHKFKTRIAAGAEWSMAQGVNVNTTPAGLR